MPVARLSGIWGQFLRYAARSFVLYHADSLVSFLFRVWCTLVVRLLSHLQSVCVQGLTFIWTVIGQMSWTTQIQ